jgi:hypothetical protein
MAETILEKPVPLPVETRPITTGRIIRAFIVAAVIDCLQLPVNLAFLTGVLTVPSELCDIGLDIFAAITISRLIGFHWVFLPSFLVESVPGFDLCPTWLASVAYVAWRRRKQSKTQPPVIPATILDSRPLLTSPSSNS